MWGFIINDKNATTLDEGFTGYPTGNIGLDGIPEVQVHHLDTITGSLGEAWTGCDTVDMRINDGIDCGGAVTDVMVVGLNV